MSENSNKPSGVTDPASKTQSTQSSLVLSISNNSTANPAASEDKEIGTSDAEQRGCKSELPLPETRNCEKRNLSCINVKNKSDSSETSAKKKRVPCPWQLHPPPRPFKKARYAWQIKNYEHTIARMRRAIAAQQQSAPQSAGAECGYPHNVFTADSYNSACCNVDHNSQQLGGQAHVAQHHYSNIQQQQPHHNLQYSSNLYNPLFRWSKLTSAVDTPINRMLQNIFFNSEPPQAPPDIHPLLMLSLAESNRAAAIPSESCNESNMPLEGAVHNLLSSQFQSPVSGLNGNNIGSPAGMHSPPTSDYDSSSDDASLGDEVLTEPSMMQHMPSYSPQNNMPASYHTNSDNQHEYYQYSNMQQHAVAAACQRVQNSEDSSIMFQNAMINCSFGLQNRHLLNLQLQNLCERMQQNERNSKLLFQSYQQQNSFPVSNSPHVPSDSIDDVRSLSGLESFRRNTPSETESETTQTDVPLVSTSTIGTDDESLRAGSTSSGRPVSDGPGFDGVECELDNEASKEEGISELSDETESEVSLSEDSSSEVMAPCRGMDLSPPEDDTVDVNNSRGSGVVPSVLNSLGVTNKLCHASNFSSSMKEKSCSLSSSKCNNEHKQYIGKHESLLKSQRALMLDTSICVGSKNSSEFVAGENPGMCYLPIVSHSSNINTDTIVDRDSDCLNCVTGCDNCSSKRNKICQVTTTRENICKDVIDNATCTKEVDSANSKLNQSSNSQVTSVLSRISREVNDVKKSSDRNNSLENDILALNNTKETTGLSADISEENPKMESDTEANEAELDGNITDMMPLSMSSSVSEDNGVTVLTCNCLIAKQSSTGLSPSSVDSSKSPAIDDSPVEEDEECHECCLQHEQGEGDVTSMQRDECVDGKQGTARKSLVAPHDSHDEDGKMDGSFPRDALNDPACSASTRAAPEYKTDADTPSTTSAVVRHICDNNKYFLDQAFHLASIKQGLGYQKA